MPGDGGSVPLPKVTPSHLGQLALHPGCPVLSLCSVLAGLDLAMPGEAGGLSSVRLPVADTHPVGTRRLHPSPSPWGWPHTRPHTYRWPRGAPLSSQALQKIRQRKLGFALHNPLVLCTPSPCTGLWKSEKSEIGGCRSGGPVCFWSPHHWPVDDRGLPLSPPSSCL